MLISAHADSQLLYSPGHSLSSWTSSAWSWIGSWGSLLKVPSTADALAFWIATDIFWRKNEGALPSPVVRRRRLPSSDIHSLAEFPHEPAVSTAKGMKWWLIERSAYLALFASSALSAA